MKTVLIRTFTCPVCGTTMESFTPGAHQHDGRWVAFIDASSGPPSAPAPVPPVEVKRGPGRPRKTPID